MCPISLCGGVQVKDALVQFDAALEMNPNEEEAQAALYNKACCHARRFGAVLFVCALFSRAFWLGSVSNYLVCLSAAEISISFSWLQIPLARCSYTC